MRLGRARWARAGAWVGRAWVVGKLFIRRPRLAAPTIDSRSIDALKRREESKNWQTREREKELQLARLHATALVWRGPCSKNGDYGFWE